MDTDRHPLSSAVADHAPKSINPECPDETAAIACEDDCFVEQIKCRSGCNSSDKDCITACNREYIKVY